MIRLFLPILLFLSGCAATEPKIIFAVRPARPSALPPTPPPPINPETAAAPAEAHDQVASGLSAMLDSIWFWWGLAVLVALYFLWDKFGPMIRSWFSKKNTKVFLNEKDDQ